MNFYKRATISILRQPIKSGIFLLLIILLGVLASGAIAVQSAIYQTDQNLRRRMPAIATIVYNFGVEETHAIYEETGEWPLIEPDVLTSEILGEIGSFPQVKVFDYSIALVGGQVSAQDLSTWSYSEIPSMVYDEDLGINLQVGGVSSEEFLSVRSDFMHMVQGRSFNALDLSRTEPPFPVLISSGFAEANGFGISSIFEVQTVVFDSVPHEDGEGYRQVREEPPLYEEDYILEVVGIFQHYYHELPDINDDGFFELLMRRELVEHRIYVPHGVAEAMFEVASRARFTQNAPVINNFFLLNDPLDFPDFANEVENMLGNWRAVDYSRGFEDISVSMENVQGAANLILFMTIGATILLIGLLILLFLHDRKHEVGVYLALGEQRIKIIFQIILELIPLAMLGMTIALFIGNIMADSLSREMLRQGLANPPVRTIAEEVHYLEELGYRFELSHEEMMEYYEINMNIETVVLFYVVGFGTVLIAAIIPISRIVKLSPKKVLLSVY